MVPGAQLLDGNQLVGGRGSRTAGVVIARPFRISDFGFRIFHSPPIYRKKHSENRCISSGGRQPRSGDRLLAWGVSPRELAQKNRRARNGRQTPSSAAASRLDQIRNALPGAHAPGYVSVAPSALAPDEVSSPNADARSALAGPVVRRSRALLPR
jgi:hypothetical protein